MKVEFYMPTSHPAASANLQDAFLRRFGGFTAIPGTGAWLSPTGRKFVEPVEVLHIYASDDASEFVREQATRFGIEAEQEAVLYVIDGKQHFVDTTPHAMAA